MEARKNILTRKGLETLEEELLELKAVRRKEVAEKIKDAREQGDLSENAEYDAAKDEQRDIEARITEIEKILKDVEIIDGDEIDAGKISIGHPFIVRDLEFNEDLELVIVGTSEANSLAGKISNESPMGHALLGKSVNDEVVIETPAGECRYLILATEKAD